MDEADTPYSQAFASDTGFTYDSALAEFVSGLLRQKDQRPANAVFGATFTASAASNWNPITPTLSGGAAATGGLLVCTGATNIYAEYSDASIGNLGSIGAVKLKYKPNYSGSPASNTNIVSFAPTSGNAGRLIFFHASTGTLRVTAYNSAGTAIHTAVVFSASAWSPTSGTTYEMEFNWDTSTGTFRCFVNGGLIGTVSGSTFSRGTTAILMRVGAGTTYPVSNASYDDVVLFSTVQHTGAYTAGYSLAETIYLASVGILPEWAHSGAGEFLDAVNFAATDTLSPRYTIQIGQSGNYLYWNGSAWVTSNGSYAQSNPASTVLANIASLPVSGEVFIQVKIHFTDSNSQQSVDTLTVTIHETTGFNSAPQKITPVGRFQAGKLISFLDSVDIPDDTGIRFIMEVESDPKYWNGDYWAHSNGTYDEANSGQDIEDHIASLIAVDSLVKLITFLQSDDPEVTPEISSATVEYLQDPAGMRGFLDSILAFIGAESLTDEEFAFDEIQALSEPEYTQEVYDALKLVLNTRESVSSTMQRLGDYFEAAGLDVDFSDSAPSSNIFVGGVLE